MPEDVKEKKKPVSPYRLHLKPNEEQRREQWNLIFISDIEVTIDFFHTDMLEKVISIQGATIPVEEVKEEIKEE